MIFGQHGRTHKVHNQEGKSHVGYSNWEETVLAVIERKTRTSQLALLKSYIWDFTKKSAIKYSFKK